MVDHRRQCLVMDCRRGMKQRISWYLVKVARKVTLLDIRPHVVQRALERMLVECRRRPLGQNRTDPHLQDK